MDYEKREADKARAARVRRIADDIGDQERAAAAMDRAAARNERTMRRAAAKIDAARVLLCDAVMLLDEYALCVHEDYGAEATQASRLAGIADGNLYAARRALAAKYLNGE